MWIWVVDALDARRPRPRGSMGSAQGGSGGTGTMRDTRSQAFRQKPVDLREEMALGSMG